MTQPKYKVGDIVLFPNGWKKSGEQWWHGGRVLKVYDRSYPHLADEGGEHFKYKFSIPPELVFGEWLVMCEPSLRPGTEADLEYKGPDKRKDPGIQKMLSDVRFLQGL